MLVAVVPFGARIGDAEKFRVILSVLSTYSEKVQPNPLKALSVGRIGVPEDNKDGAFGLIGGFRSGVTLAVSVADAAVT